MFSAAQNSCVVCLKVVSIFSALASPKFYIKSQAVCLALKKKKETFYYALNIQVNFKIC